MDGWIDGWMDENLVQGTVGRSNPSKKTRHWRKKSSPRFLNYFLDLNGWTQEKKSSECSLEFNLSFVVTEVDAQLIAQGQAVSDYELVFAWGFYHDEDSPILIFGLLLTLGLIFYYIRMYLFHVFFVCTEVNIEEKYDMNY